ncbi:HNH endonuclease [Amycolatopsis sp. FBCC-B4732]|uniref:HNH endonuclease signature motif containing protein n=1 Tax=Amycolatopsis sp. FBCC-B4732 TaxID=3079339 RepID=UPI001FF40E3B|nr:HNH endonuclease signature motif containing protein [Amycolatopsis sp. FBCC-B4732]UOX89584.1 HNH endonuclease [Amycolatopsis sp. FBCC-B4732]
MEREAVWQADAEALADRIVSLLTVVRSAEAEIGALLVEIESRGVMELFGYRSTARLYEHLADVPKSAAERTFARAQALHPGHSLDGAAALAPATGVAARDGLLSAPMIDTIVEAVARIPAEHRDAAERDLLAFAADAGHKQVAALGARILAHLDPDGAEPEDTEPATPARELSLRRKRTGVWELSGRFDDETGTRASALLDALAERRHADDGPDWRSPQERYGNAFSDAVDLALDSRDLPMQAGERAHVLVAVSLADLKSGLGQATLGDTGSMSAAEARIHACDCKLIPAVLGAHNEPLDLGRARRLISPGLRRALFLRDRGCAFPGCHRPPRHCQGHHVRHWAEGGLTDLANLVLLCAHHHRLLHRSGWQVRIATDGLPEFLPPGFLDKRRKPRRNNLHQPLPFAA